MTGRQSWREVVERHRREGLVSKRRSAPYRSYGSGDAARTNRERKALRRLLHCDRDVREWDGPAVLPPR
jgi:hypothetical protein